MRRGTEIALRSLHWLLLGGWVGSWMFFALVLARLAFRVLPSAEVAGQLISPTLATLHWYGAFAGVTLAGLAALLRRGRSLVALPLVLAAVCLVNELGVTPQLAALHDLAFGPGGNVESAAAYRRWHGISMSIFSVVLLGAIGLVVLSTRRETPQTADST
jgi:hypothetical protein